MTKVVYNACYGGFSLSPLAIARYAEIKGFSIYSKASKYGIMSHYTDPEFENHFWDREIQRSDPALVQVVEELGTEADGECANLRIADVPEGTLYRIDEYDGFESVMTNDSYDWQTA